VSIESPDGTREAWLDAAAAQLAAWIGQRAPGAAVPSCHVSVGFPRGSRGRKRAIGQCWDGSKSMDGQAHLFVCPSLGDPVEVLHVLLHEQIHATVGCVWGHRGAFVRAAKAAGLVGPWTATTPGPGLSAHLGEMAARLGPYPHSRLTLPERGKVGSRLRLWQCDCPVKVRVASDDFAATCDTCDSPFNQLNQPGGGRKP
jgi:hypothetical protein